MKVLVTGAAGFIGSAVVRDLLGRGDSVLGLDDLNDYYDPRLKESRLGMLSSDQSFLFSKGDIQDANFIQSAFRSFQPDRVIHLAAQAGVRYSLSHPERYIGSNISGTLNILEACRHFGTDHLVYASSSSVYGANTKIPFSTLDRVDHPVSLYACTKKSNELMAHAYSHLFKIPVTGLRFFTVYGPWGRPDMSVFLFTQKIINGEEIELYNFGSHKRDFTYVDDIAAGVVRVLDRPAKPDPEWSGLRPDPRSSSAPYRIYNIGNQNPVELKEMVTTLEEALGIKAKIKLSPMQPGDVPDTHADVSDLERDFGFKPSTKLKDGLGEFVKWYRSYYVA